MRGRETVKIAMQNQIMTRETSEKKNGQPSCHWFDEVFLHNLMINW